MPVPALLQHGPGGNVVPQRAFCGCFLWRARVCVYIYSPAKVPGLEFLGESGPPKVVPQFWGIVIVFGGRQP